MKAFKCEWCNEYGDGSGRASKIPMMEDGKTIEPLTWAHIEICEKCYQKFCWKLEEMMEALLEKIDGEEKTRGEH
uniref:Uncharacterized protein n=1 Tax=viral metagenome TaxID=1070528 RepID=A0A6M3M7D7_9ZZZZ